MEFIENLPLDSALANQLDSFIRDLKAALVTRLPCENADGFEEHHARDHNSFGRHPASEVLFTQVHNDVSQMQGFSPRVPGSLHLVRDPLTLYVVKPNREFERVSGASHADFPDSSSSDAHPEFHLLTLSREHENNLEIQQPWVRSDSTQHEDAPISESHLDLPIHEAHPEMTFPLSNAFITAWIGSAIFSTSSPTDAERYRWGGNSGLTENDMLLTPIVNTDASTTGRSAIVRLETEGSQIRPRHTGGIFRVLKLYSESELDGEV